MDRITPDNHGAVADAGTSAAAAAAAEVDETMSAHLGSRTMTELRVQNIQTRCTI